MNSKTSAPQPDFPVCAEVFHSAFSDGFRFVADVAIVEDDVPEMTACEIAYVATNTFDRPWFEKDIASPSSYVKDKKGCRSTSVGDYVKLSWMVQAPTWYRVDRCGFSKIQDSDEVEYVSVVAGEWKVEKMTLRELRQRHNVDGLRYLREAVSIAT